MRQFGCLALAVGLAACAQAPESTDLAPAPMQLRDGVTVTVDGVALEVRRTRYRWSYPAAPILTSDGEIVVPDSPPPGEFADGQPAVAVSGVPPGPGAIPMADRAMFLACGFDDGNDAWRRGGFEGDMTARSIGEPMVIYHSVERCPVLDSAEGS